MFDRRQLLAAAASATTFVDWTGLSRDENAAWGQIIKTVGFTPEA